MNKTILSPILTTFVFLSFSIFAHSSSWNPQDWNSYSQRPALAPVMEKTAEELTAASSGEFRCNGAWRKTYAVKTGQYYQIHAEYRARDIELPRRSILVKVDWKDADGKRISWPEYPATLEKIVSGWNLIEGVYPAPEGAESAVVELILRWTKTGSVCWKNVTLAPCEAPESRTVTLAAVNFRPKNRSTTEQNLDHYVKFIEEAGKQGADLVCLPEGITVVNTGKKYIDVAEPVPGPTTQRLGAAAKDCSLYVVAGIYEKEGDTVYNTAVLMGREGELIGVYRKVALPREEIEGGITPGDSFPVFETDFGKVGMMICWDVHFPEPARVLARGGAEIILLPIWGGVEPLFAARAIENQVYLVTSSFDARTGIWDREGKILADATENGTLAITTIDLTKRTLWPWLGEFRARIPTGSASRERMI